MRQVLRMVAYLWPLPYTLFGVAVGLVLGGRFQRVEGVIEIHGSRIEEVLNKFFIPAMAMTMGHVVFGKSEVALEITRAHERVHVRQFERWGPFFLPAYLLASLVLYVRGRDGYRENPFEVEAYAEDEKRRHRSF